MQGGGAETVIAEIDGKRLQTKQNLSEEKQLTKAAVAACSTLTQVASPRTLTEKQASKSVLTKDK